MAVCPFLVLLHSVCIVSQEVLLPLYSLGVLIVMKVMIPNPNFPVMDTPRGEAHLFSYFQQLKNHTVAVVPNNTETQVSVVFAKVAAIDFVSRNF